MLRLTYKELDSRILKKAVSGKERIEVEIETRHASALDTLMEIVTEANSWATSKPSVVQRWITLQKSFFLSIRALVSHSQLVELLPVLLSSKVTIDCSHEPDGSRVLSIEPK